MRIVILLATGLIAAGGGGLYLYREMKPAPTVAAATVEAPKLAEVYVAKAEIPRGAILKPEHLGRMPLEDAALTPEMAPAGPEGDAALLGAVALQPLARGVPIARSSVVQPGDRGFLAAVLPQGKRAISIPISEVAGLSGLVLPGDRVDIILTYSLAKDTIDAGRDVRASETVLENIRVLALDQRLSQGEPAGENSALSDAPPIARTATLQVTPQEAEVITLATSLGDLSMVLNSVHDGGDAADLAEAHDGAAAPRRMTLDSEVTSLLRREAAGEDGPAAPALADRTTRIQIVRGATAGAIELGHEVVAAAGPAAEVPPEDVPVE